MKHVGAAEDAPSSQRARWSRQNVNVIASIIKP
jgi:hypothetical protein